MKPSLLIVFCALSLLAMPSFAAGKNNLSEHAIADSGDLDIAGVVNEEAISSYDVDSRIKFIMATTKLSNTPDVIERIRPQVVRSLIDEKLQLQEAAKEQIKVTDKDIAEATADIEKRRNMAPGAIAVMLAQNNVPKETFTQQIKAQIAWDKLLLKKVRPHVRVSDEELEIAKKKLATPEKKEEFKIAVLMLPVDKPDRDNEVRKIGDKLVSQVRAGASFEEVSRQFSKGGNSNMETFWVLPDQLDPVVAHALANARAGTITDPIRGSEGYTIIKVYDTRDLAPADNENAEITLKEILLKLKPEAGEKESDVLLQIGEEVAKHPGTCEEKGVANISNLEDFDITVDFRHTLLSELPEALRVIATSLKVGEISTPFASDEGIRLYMLCDKKASSAQAIDPERVYRMLMQQKLELAAQKYMRDLRREAFIEIRK